MQGAQYRHPLQRCGDISLLIRFLELDPQSRSTRRDGPDWVYLSGVRICYIKCFKVTNDDSSKLSPFAMDSYVENRQVDQRLIQDRFKSDAAEVNEVRKAIGIATLKACPSRSLLLSMPLRLSVCVHLCLCCSQGQSRNTATCAGSAESID